MFSYASPFGFFGTFQNGTPPDFATWVSHLHLTLTVPSPSWQKVKPAGFPSSPLGGWEAFQLWPFHCMGGGWSPFLLTSPGLETSKFRGLDCFFHRTSLVGFQWEWYTFTHILPLNVGKYTIHPAKFGITFHQPKFPWTKGMIPYFSPPFGVETSHVFSVAS